ncbi:MAG: aspartate/glutamate racemase family protein [Candidatus Nitrosotalea sp.]|nr:aspartate/glutamate racemase family protein [Candidatus Nitrosotalea sp.]
MPKIAVFDSGLGSLSVIKSIQKKINAEVIYFADQDNYPYGTKSVRQLDKIIKSTISKLQEKFEPDIIVVGSNTPSLLLDIEKMNKIIGVFPPLKEAVSKTKTGLIGILATRSVVKSKSLDKYIKKNVSYKIQVTKINATPLVDLVESGKFLSKKQVLINIIKKTITPYIEKNIDVFTLSSTHLPFLLPILKELFPNVLFLDPADLVTQRVLKILNHKKSKNVFKIYASGNTENFHKKLMKIGIKNKVNSL